MDTTHSDIPQARTQDVVDRPRIGFWRAFAAAIEENGFFAEKARARFEAAQQEAFRAKEAHDRDEMAQAIVAALIRDSGPVQTWKPMSSAPAGQLGLCIDIWCAESECRRTDCFWHEGRWCYEVFDGIYDVVAVRAPAAWMPAPTKPENLAD